MSDSLADGVVESPAQVPPRAPVPRAPTGEKGRVTRAAISESATLLFSRHGYTGTSVRVVAAQAGTDSALVIRYFGSKEQLFLETMPMVGQFEHITAGPLEGLGRRLVESVLGTQQATQISAYRALVRASDSDAVRQRLVQAQQDMFVTPMAPNLKGPDPQLRARLVAAQLSGLLDALAIFPDESITHADRDRLVELYGAAIQLLIDWPA
ncbi:MAG: putative TetR-family transcriptional regulator [Aeromicrobium sp.]|nr:putative TetR-family transcriptional regulator [Aeromicrobium sp.]